MSRNVFWMMLVAAVVVGFMGTSVRAEIIIVTPTNATQSSFYNSPTGYQSAHRVN